MSSDKTTTPPGVHIEKRHINHHFDTAIPCHWANGNPVITAFFNALSTVIPAGEKFFIRTVKEATKAIDDPALQNEVHAFIAQESQHRIGHLAMNEWIRRQGYPVVPIERSVKRLLGFAEKHFSLKHQLALTVALEHFSCLLSDQFLRHAGLHTHLAPDMRDFLVAHCIEENEHKAVAFDVYQARYGKDYLARIVQMLLVTVIFAPNVFRIQLVYLRHEKQLFNIRAWQHAVRYFWFSPGWFNHTVPGYLAYYKRHFHPWQHDNRPLIQHYLDQAKHQRCPEKQIP